MPVCVAQIVQKGTVRGATACHDGNLVSVACHRAPLAAQPLATRAWKGPRATCWWMCWSVGTEWSLAAASYYYVPTLQRIHQRVALEPFQARVARGCATSGARWQAALTRLPSWRVVAPLMVLFLHCLGDTDGHLMPLSPAVRVRYDTL